MAPGHRRERSRCPSCLGFDAIEPYSGTFTAEAAALHLRVQTADDRRAKLTYNILYAIVLAAGLAIVAWAWSSLA